MISVQALSLSVALLLNTSTGESYFGPRGNDRVLSPARVKQVELWSLERRATDCVAFVVSRTPRLTSPLKATRLADLIIKAMRPCAAPIRAMIDAYDEVHGKDLGEKYFMGLYLDELPITILRLLEGTAGP